MNVCADSFLFFLQPEYFFYVVMVGVDLLLRRRELTEMAAALCIV